MNKTNLKKILWGTVSLSMVFTIWYFASRMPSLRKLLPDPLDVLSFIFAHFGIAIGKTTIWGHLYWSMTRVMTGYLMASIVGIFLGFIIGWFKVGEAIVKPFYLVLRSIPSIAWIPLAILWFGIGEQSKIFIIFISTMLIIMTNVIDGVRDVNPEYLGVARMLGTKEKQIFFHIVLPSCCGNGPFLGRSRLDYPHGTNIHEYDPGFRRYHHYRTRWFDACGIHAGIGSQALCLEYQG